MSLVNIPVDTVDTYYNLETRLDDESYRLTLRWNSTSETWYLDIEGLTVEVLLLGLPLIVGGDLLKPYAILVLGSLYVYDTERPETNPTRESFGDRHRLVHVTRGQTLDEAIAEGLS